MEIPTESAYEVRVPEYLGNKLAASFLHKPNDSRKQDRTASYLITEGIIWINEVENRKTETGTSQSIWNQWEAIPQHFLLCGSLSPTSQQSSFC